MADEEEDGPAPSPTGFTHIIPASQLPQAISKMLSLDSGQGGGFSSNPDANSSLNDSVDRCSLPQIPTSNADTDIHMGCHTLNEGEVAQ